MKLATKLTLALVTGVVLIMGGYGWIQMQREVIILDGDLLKNQKFGRGVAAAIEAIWASDGEARARALVETIDQNGPDVVRLHWLWLDELRAAPPADLVAGDLDALTQRNVVARRQDEADEWVRHIYIPIAIPGARPAVIEVVESLREEGRYIDMNRMQIAIATVLVAGMCGLTAMVLGYWFVGRPMEQLRNRARAVGTGDFAARLSLRQRDEIGELAGELNAMSARLAETKAKLAEETEARISTLEQLRHTDRLTTVGRLAAGIAHELGTPLNVIAGRATKIVAAEGGRGPAADFARIIQEQVARMTGVIRQLLDFSRRQGPKLGLVSLEMLAARTIDLLTPFAQKHGATIELVTPAAVPLARIDQNQIQQALANVVINGVQAMPRGGRLHVSIETAEVTHPTDPGATPGLHLCLAVEDQGEGIAAEHLPHIFEPFYTTKGVGEGTGLGLSVAHGIVADHGGWIDVESEVGRGTRVAIFLAAAEPGAAEVAS